MALSPQREAEFFDRLPKSAKRDLTKGALRVLLAILEFRKKDEHEVICTDRGCAEILGYHHNSVRRHYPELEAKGMIRRLDVNRGCRTIEIVFRLRPPKGGGDTNGTTSANPSRARASLTESARPDEQECAPDCAKARAPSSLVDSGQMKETDPVPSPVLDLPHAGEPMAPVPTPERDGPAHADWKTKSEQERAAIHGIKLATQAEIDQWTEDATGPPHVMRTKIARACLNLRHEELKRLMYPPEPPRKAPAPPLPPQPKPKQAASTGKRPWTVEQTHDPADLYRMLASLGDPAQKSRAVAGAVDFCIGRYKEEDPLNPVTRKHFRRAFENLSPDHLRTIIGEVEATKRFKERPSRLLARRFREALDLLREPGAQKQPPGARGKSPGGCAMPQSARTPVQEGVPDVK